ncbi:MAG: SprT-like domain-containing protein [Thermodesulfovibrionales bacterium]
MQLALPFTSDQDSLLECLKELTGADIRLTLTDNASSMISFRKESGVTFLRLHRMFLQAGPDVVDEIARFIRNMRLKTPLIRQFIREYAGALPVRPAKRTVLVAQGKYHDLSEMGRIVNNQYFKGTISAGITWGTRKTGHAIRRRILGSYNSRTNTIRINPILDRKNVPQYYLEFIIYHEMLHADMGVARKNGRREVHSREFRRREKMFRHFEKALLWEKKG